MFLKTPRNRSTRYFMFPRLLVEIHTSAAKMCDFSSTNLCVRGSLINNWYTRDFFFFFHAYTFISRITINSVQLERVLLKKKSEASFGKNHPVVAKIFEFWRQNF